LTKHYTILDVREILAAIRGETTLPRNACLLTFDDGFLDHYTVVFPCLDYRRLPAVFFVPGRPIEEREILDVHGIHFVLAAVSDPRQLIEEVFGLLRQYRPGHDVPDDRTLYQRSAARTQRRSQTSSIWIWSSCGAWCVTAWRSGDMPTITRGLTRSRRRSRRTRFGGRSPSYGSSVLFAQASG